MRRIAMVLIVVLAAAGAAMAATPQQQILEVISQQENAWNRGDLEGYMAGYWKSPKLTFFSGGKASHGWEETLEHYKQRYQGEGREMGKLELSDLEVHMLAPDAAYVTGHWRLMMPKDENPQGLTTLVLRRFREGWRIVHDHSSSE